MTNTLRRPFNAIVLSMATLLVSSISPLAIADGIDNSNAFHKGIQVQGHGVVTAKPDSFNINFTVMQQGKTMDEAKQKNNQVIQVITNKIKSLGIPNLILQTQWYNANPTYKYDKNGRSTITGYEVNNSITVNVKGADSSKIEDDTITDNNATNAGDPNFYLSDNNIAYDDALKLAVKQARHRADIIATEAGGTLLAIDTIVSETQSSPQSYAAPRMTLMSKNGMDAAALPTQVLAGPMDVEASVVIRYTLK